jgi:hypothetical protein
MDGSFLGTVGKLSGVEVGNLIGGELARTAVPPVGRLVGQDEGNLPCTLGGVL